MAVLVEEVGEVARALQDQGAAELRTECVQVAAMALRMALEGAREYPRSWPEGDE
jgi:NTP pyrophosphatase (non-canonical NTP hydrolase)